MLENSVYTEQQDRTTIYCGAIFDTEKKVTFPDGFETTKHKKRAQKIEWEHVVPAENFGRNFSEWREGDESCVTKKGKEFKGRRCAEKVNQEYRFMQSDMYNLYPAIGAVNAMRSNYNFVMLGDEESSFGSCAMKISNRKAEPPTNARGVIARSYLYMQHTYPKYAMSKQQQQLMDAWDKQFPVTQWECKRAERIASLQGNDNPILEHHCAQAGLLTKDNLAYKTTSEVSQGKQ